MQREASASVPEGRVGVRFSKLHRTDFCNREMHKRQPVKERTCGEKHILPGRVDAGKLSSSSAEDRSERATFSVSGSSVE